MTQVVRSNFSKGPVYPGKGPNENFGASEWYLGPSFWNFAPKGPTWQPWSTWTGQTRSKVSHHSNGPSNHCRPCL